MFFLYVLSKKIQQHMNASQLPRIQYRQHFASVARHFIPGAKFYSFVQLQGNIGLLVFNGIHFIVAAWGLVSDVNDVDDYILILYILLLQTVWICVLLNEMLLLCGNLTYSLWTGSQAQYSLINQSVRIKLLLKLSVSCQFWKLGRPKLHAVQNNVHTHNASDDNCWLEMFSQLNKYF